MSSEKELKQLMRDYILEKCLLNKDFKLSAGGVSQHYFDIKKASLNGAFLSHFSDYVLDYFLKQHGLSPNLVGGMTIGADFLTAGLVLKSYEKNKTIKQGSIVRKQIKAHGTENLIENNLADSKGEKNILVVDDVITSGSSIFKAYQDFLKSGYSPIGLLTVVDREAGGMQYLEKETELPVLAIFKSSDFNL